MGVAIVMELVTPAALESGIETLAVKFVTKVLVVNEAAQSVPIDTQNRHAAPIARLAAASRDGRLAFGCTSLLKSIRRSIGLLVHTSTRSISIGLSPVEMR